MGFAQEIKDFLGAWQQGEKINASRTDREYKDALTDAQKKKTERDNDPDTLALQDKQARANLAKTQAGIGAIGASTGLTNERVKALRLQQKLIQDQQNAGSGLLPPGGAGALPAQSNAGGAIPMAPSTIDTEPQYADGGLVEPDEDDTETESEPLPSEGAIPATPAVQPPTDVSARSRAPGGLEGVVSPALVADATKAGLTFGANALGLSRTGGVQTPQQARAAQMYLRGAGGLTDAEMEAAKKAVDPDGKLTEAQRNVAALGSVYQYQLNKGNPEGAQKIAFQMLQHYRAMSTRYAVIAAHAAKDGDLDTAAQAAVKSYANIPDGRDLEVHVNPDNPKQLVYSYTDSVTGNTIAKGLVTPQQLVASAMGMAQGGFDKAILMAAGAREDPKLKGKPPSMADRKTTGTMAAEPIAAAKEAWQKKNPDAAVDDDYWNNLGDATQHIMQQNPKSTPNEAFKAAQALYTLDKKDPAKTNFKIEKGDEDGVNVVKLSTGHKFTLSDDQLEPILLARSAALKARGAKGAADEAEKKKPGIMDKVGAVGGAIGGAISEAGSAAANIGGILGRGAVDAIPEGVKDAVDNGTWNLRQAARRGADAVSNKGALPADEFNSPL